MVHTKLLGKVLTEPHPCRVSSGLWRYTSHEVRKITEIVAVHSTRMLIMLSYYAAYKSYNNLQIEWQKDEKWNEWLYMSTTSEWLHQFIEGRGLSICNPDCKIPIELDTIGIIQHTNNYQQRLDLSAAYGLMIVRFMYPNVGMGVFVSLF